MRVLVFGYLSVMRYLTHISEMCLIVMSGNSNVQSNKGPNHGRSVGGYERQSMCIRGQSNARHTGVQCVHVCDGHRSVRVCMCVYSQRCQ